MAIKKDHIDCWNNQYDQNIQHMKYMSTYLLYYHMLITNTIRYKKSLLICMKGVATYGKQ